MRSRIELLDSSHYKELQVIAEVEASPVISQRQISQRLGIALGLTNALVRNLVKKGYIRSQQASWKRWVYALTPEGLCHKLRITLVYVHQFLDHYQNVRNILRKQLEPLALHEESRVAIYGTSEFAELVYLGLKEIGIYEIDVFAESPEFSDRFLGMPVLDINEILLHKYDRIMMAGVGDSVSLNLVQMCGQSDTSNKMVFFFDEVA